MPGADPSGLRFGEAAEAYERGRPEYPGEVVEWLLADAPNIVVDLGAGTGKLTRALTSRVATVVAVEPDPAMRAALSSRLPDVTVLAGTGESLPLADGFADAIVAGQAWHWVDPARAVPEAARVVRTGGSLGLVWNDRDEDDPWIHELSTLLQQFGSSPDASYEPVVGPPFSPMETMELSWTNRVSIDAVVDMIASRSYAIALPADRRTDLVARVRALAEGAQESGTGLVPVRYVTRVYRTRLD